MNDVDGVDSSLTFEGVRRLLEKDLGMEKFALDVHKRFVKQSLLEVPLHTHEKKKEIELF